MRFNRFSPAETDHFQGLGVSLFHLPTLGEVLVHHGPFDRLRKTKSVSLLACSRGHIHITRRFSVWISPQKFTKHFFLHLKQCPDYFHQQDSHHYRQTRPPVIRCARCFFVLSSASVRTLSTGHLSRSPFLSSRSRLHGRTINYLPTFRRRFLAFDLIAGISTSSRALVPLSTLSVLITPGHVYPYMCHSMTGHPSTPRRQPVAAAT